MSLTPSIVGSITSSVTGAFAGGGEAPTDTGLVWAGAGSDLYTQAGGNDLEFKVQTLGVGTPAFSSPTPGLILPNSAGDFVAVPPGEPPVLRATWLGGKPFSPAGDQPYLYGAPAFENIQTWSYDLSNAVWTKNRPGMAALDADGITGNANGASTVSDTSNTVIEFLQGNVVIPNDTNWVTARYIVLKDTDQTRFPSFGLDLALGTTQRIRANFNTATGEFRTWLNTGTTDISVIDKGNWWIITLSVLNNAAGNTQARMYIDPARELSLAGGGNAAATGSVVIGNAELFTGPNMLNETCRGAAPIQTAGAAASTPEIGFDYDLGNHANNQGAYYFEFRPTWDAAESETYHPLLSMANTNTVNTTYVQNGTQWRLRDTVTTSLATQGLVRGQVVKYGGVYDATAGLMQVTIDGVLGSEVAYSGTFPVTAGRILGYGFPTRPGGIRNLRRYDLPYAEAKAKIAALMAA
jgi:hypothetical protein